jgi:hypothetical protein
VTAIEDAGYRAGPDGVQLAAITLAAREARRFLGTPRGRCTLSFTLRELWGAGLPRAVTPAALFELGNVATTLLILRATELLQVDGRDVTAATTVGILLVTGQVGHRPQGDDSPRDQRPQADPRPGTGPFVDAPSHPGEHRRQATGVVAPPVGGQDGDASVKRPRRGDGRGSRGRGSAWEPGVRHRACPPPDPHHTRPGCTLECAPRAGWSARIGDGAGLRR